MSIRKATAEELSKWNKLLSKEGLSDRRGESHRLVYGSDDTVRLAETSWSKAAAWVKRKRKTHKPHKKTERSCMRCEKKFLARPDALWCSDRCRMRAVRDISKRTDEGSK